MTFELSFGLRRSSSPTRVPSGSLVLVLPHPQAGGLLYVSHPVPPVPIPVFHTGVDVIGALVRTSPEVSVVVYAGGFALVDLCEKVEEDEATNGDTGGRSSEVSRLVVPEYLPPPFSSGRGGVPIAMKGEITFSGGA